MCGEMPCEPLLLTISVCPSGAAWATAAAPIVARAPSPVLDHDRLAKPAAEPARDQASE